jgi:acyl-CoA synthetase (AMP-forming)/AMP-acid ligase II
MRRATGARAMTPDAMRSRTLRAAGHWGDLTIADYARTQALQDPERILLIEADRRLSAAQLYGEAEALAAAFLDNGLAPGDTVSYMLPNWYETCVISLAAALTGLIINPLLPIYRERELSFMLADCRSRLLFIPAHFRNLDYRDLITGIRSGLPALEQVIVVRGPEGSDAAYQRFLGSRGEAPLPTVSADAIKMLIYTSGTTGRPKGVLHTHNTIMADVRSLADFWRVTIADSFFVPSPVTHIGGSLYAHEFVWYSGTPAVLLDMWNGGDALKLLRQHGCTISAGATPFLKDLIEASRRTGVVPHELRLFICGGAAVPPSLIREARELFPNCVSCRVYGSTEVPTITGGATPNDGIEACAETDGALCGTEIRLVDPETGREVAAGMEGEILVRGPEMLLGYKSAEDNESVFTVDGFFKTGDLGRRVGTAHLLITGRKKDLIIRAGENISSKEIEDALGDHPAIVEIAVVSVPSERTGEAICACVVLKAGATLALDEVGRFMRERGWARQKVPEALLVLPSLPRTATGKIRKDVLRAEARAGATT